MLCAGKSTSDVAAACGVCRETLWRWRQLAAFSRRLVRVKKYYRERFEDDFRFLADKAVLALFELLDSRNETVRLNTAKEVLSRFGDLNLRDEKDCGQVTLDQLNCLTEAELDALERITDKIEAFKTEHH